MKAKLEIVSDNSAAILRQADGQIAAALEAMGLQGEKHAKEYVPVVTGRLRNSISHTYDTNSAYIGTNVEYAPYGELGTARRKAKPYLRPAVQNHVSEYREILKRYLSR